MTAQPFNKLTPAQAERLALLSEELGEAQQAIGKILRHGYESTNPDATGSERGVTNRQHLEKELGDVEAARVLMAAARDITNKNVSQRAAEKVGRVRKYLHHQEGG